MTYYFFEFRPGNIKMKEKVVIKEEPPEDFVNSCKQESDDAVDPLGSFVDIKTELDDENCSDDMMNEERVTDSETNNTNNLDPLATGDNFKLKDLALHFI